MSGQPHSEIISPLVSVIIGFKDWGLERLELSIRSIHDSLEGIQHEVVISDYGSEDTASIAESAQRAGAATSSSRRTASGRDPVRSMPEFGPPWVRSYSPQMPTCCSPREP